jgi:hypothetical protein
MPAAGSDTRDLVKSGLSEVRTVILGAQILFGFQYESVFEPGFARLPDWARTGSTVAFVMMAAAFALLMAPTPFHQLSERGEATRGQARFTAGAIGWALAPFALAVGLDTAVATVGTLGTTGALSAGGAAAALAAFLWFGIGMINRTPPPSAAQSQPLPLKEKISQILTESRIVLPGVQALLGFQLIAYLMDAFTKLEPLSKVVHTVGLLSLLLAMILLMSPAPFHRIAEHGEPTERVRKLGVWLVLAALPPLGLGISCDLYVAIEVLKPPAGIAAGVALAAGALSLALWFAVPLLTRRRAGN